MPLVRRKVGSAPENAVNQVLGQGGNSLASNESKGPTTSQLEENGSERSLEDGSLTMPSGLEERSSRISPSGIEAGPHECCSIGSRRRHPQKFVEICGQNQRPISPL